MRTDHAYAVAAAAARDFNDELTVILTSVSESLGSLDEGHPAHAILLDLQGAAQRCAWKAAVSYWQRKRGDYLPKTSIA